MKKQYEKPVMLVEDFVLNDYIAACAITVPSNPQSCEAPEILGNDSGLWWIPGMFSVDLNCDSNVDAYPGVQQCYHTSANVLVLATS